MTFIKTVRFLHLLCYLVITGQLMFYFFVMADALKMAGIENFVEQRKIVDPLVHARHIPVYYACLALSIIVLILTAKNWNSSLFLSIVFASICLGLDIFLGQRENGPINSFINTHNITDPGIDWESLRSKWLSFIRIRGAISLAGFIGLLAGIFWTKT